MCLEIANTYKVPIYPISTGKNWGYGSRVPSCDVCVILSLERLNKIIACDEKLGFATLEPGVTFSQLHEYLEVKNSNLLVSCPGSSADASVIGNILERGIIQGPAANRSENIGAMEVVLANGSIIKTGFDRFGGSHASALSRTGCGPNVADLFFQSNFGIVTSMSVWLERKPLLSQFFTFRINDAIQFPALVDALQDLQMDGVLGSSCSLYNAWKMATNVSQFPFKNADVNVGLDPLWIKEFSQRNFDGAIWFGSASVAAANIKELTARIDIIQDRMSSLVDELNFDYQDEEDAFYSGVLDTSLEMVYWRKRFKPPSDLNPDRDHCGIIWCVPVVPFDGAALSSCVEIIENTLFDSGFEPIISVQCLSPRSIHMPVAIIYDRDEADHDKRAMSAARELLKALAEKGFLPYRIPNFLKASLPATTDETDILLGQLQHILDPNKILAPGRYDFTLGGKR